MDTERKDESLGAALRFHLGQDLQHCFFDGVKWRFNGRRASIVDAITGMQVRGETREETAETIGISVEAIIEAENFLKESPFVIDEHHKRMMAIANEAVRR